MACKLTCYNNCLCLLPPEHVAKSSLLENSSRPFCLDHLFGVAMVGDVVCFLRGDLLWEVDRGGDAGIVFVVAGFVLAKYANTSAELSSIIIKSEMTKWKRHE